MSKVCTIALVARHGRRAGRRAGRQASGHEAPGRAPSGATAPGSEGTPRGESLERRDASGGAGRGVALSASRCCRGAVALLACCVACGGQHGVGPGAVGRLPCWRRVAPCGASGRQPRVPSLPRVGGAPGLAVVRVVQRCCVRSFFVSVTAFLGFPAGDVVLEYTARPFNRAPVTRVSRGQAARGLGANAPERSP